VLHSLWVIALRLLSKLFEVQWPVSHSHSCDRCLLLFERHA
jgi:hypothetical protein